MNQWLGEFADYFNLAAEVLQMPFQAEIADDEVDVEILMGSQIAGFAIVDGGPSWEYKIYLYDPESIPQDPAENLIVSGRFPRQVISGFFLRMVGQILDNTFFNPSDNSTEGGELA